MYISEESVGIDNVELKLETNAKKLTLKKSLKSFPWWFKIIAYILSFIVSTVCIFFIIVKGIEFGDEKVQKWISSFLISVLTSFLLTQPIQVTQKLNIRKSLMSKSILKNVKVAVISALLVFIFRKAEYDIDFGDETDKKPNQKNLNSNEVKHFLLYFV